MTMYLPTLISGTVTVALLACSSPPKSVADAGIDDAGVEQIPDAMPDAGIDAGTPDLTIYSPRTEVDFSIEERFFEANACELDPDENCVGGAGLRTLLRFSVETPNVGEGDLFMGTPSASNEDFQYSTCHAHFHFVGYAEYRL
ncbi:MAG: hypothetical protein KJO07_12095, partial [Deltaproteobacteria bacterium]|nr:hypothetical protein [Deltaproteobacteria bacterium]